MTKSYLFVSKYEFLNLVTSFGFSQFILALSGYLRAIIFFPVTDNNALASWFFWQVVLPFAGLLYGHRINISRISTIEKNVATDIQTSKSYFSTIAFFLVVILSLLIIVPENSYISAILMGTIPFAIYVVFLRNTSWFVGNKIGQNEISKLNYLSILNSSISLVVSFVLIYNTPWHKMSSDLQSLLMNFTLLIGSSFCTFIYYLACRHKIIVRKVSISFRESLTENAALFPPALISVIGAIMILVLLNSYSMIVFGLYAKLLLLLTIFSVSLTNRIMNVLHSESLGRNRFRISGALLLLNTPVILALLFFHDELVAVISSNKVVPDWTVFYWLLAISLINSIWVVEIGNLIRISELRRSFGEFILKYVLLSMCIGFLVMIAFFGLHGLYASIFFTYLLLIVIVNLKIRYDKM